jgi:hypothetical protein
MYAIFDLEDWFIYKYVYRRCVVSDLHSYQIIRLLHERRFQSLSCQNFY